MFRCKNVQYSDNQTVETAQKCGNSTERMVFIQVSEYENLIELKIRDVNEYSFNFTDIIDWNKYEKIKSEQCLEISFDEFKQQIVELLKQSKLKQMLIRLEVEEGRCSIVFYEKSKIKSLIFLRLELNPTDQKEIIEEMSATLCQLTNTNRGLMKQLQESEKSSETKESDLKNMKAKQMIIEDNFRKQIQIIEHTFLAEICTLERKICEKLERTQLRQLKLICDVECVKTESKLKSESCLRLVQNLQFLRGENETKQETIRILNGDIEKLTLLKNKVDLELQSLRQTVFRKEETIIDLKKDVSKLRNEIQEATKIIQQKNKTQDELAKDLVQANTMLVNFNHQKDSVSRELDKVRSVLNEKEGMLEKTLKDLKVTSEKFAKYQEEFNAEEVKKIKHELFLAKQRIEELEKQNREAVKLNGILTKKLASGEPFDLKNVNWTQAK